MNMKKSLDKIRVKNIEKANKITSAISARLKVVGKETKVERKKAEPKKVDFSKIVKEVVARREKVLTAENKDEDKTKV